MNFPSDEDLMLAVGRGGVWVENNFAIQGNISSIHCGEQP
jgi:hypothetical protein